MSAINVTVVCQFDAEHRQLRMVFLDPSDGSVVANLPQIRLDLRDMVAATQIDEEHAVEMLCRLTHFADGRDGSLMRCWVPATIPESDATPLESADEVEDLYLGGGGGGLQKFIFHQFFGAALLCYPTEDGENPVEGSSLVYVSQPFKLRQISGAVVPTGTGTHDTVTYSNYDWSIQKRTATIAGQSVFEVITPRYLEGDLIVAANVPNNLGASELLDINVDGRAWSKAYNQS